MSEIVIMPKLGLTMTSGQISKWLKKVGDRVTAGEPLVEIATDKINAEVESPAAGYLLEILAQEGEEKDITVPICIIGEKDEVPVPAKSSSQSVEPAQGAGRIFITPIAKKLARENGIDYSKMKGSGPNGRIVLKDMLPLIAEHKEDGSQGDLRIKVTPIARKIAEENHLDYKLVKGTGPDGRIVKEDVLSYIESQKNKRMQVAKPIVESMPAAENVSVSAGAKTVPLAGIRKIIAQRLSQSKHDIPHTYFKISVDAGKIMELKNKIAHVVKVRTGKKATLNDIIIKGVALALEAYPDINVSLIDNSIVYHDDINIGIAVNSDKGLIVPVVRNANRKGLSELCKCSGELIERAKAGKLSHEDISGGTFTVSNLGAYQIDEFCAIINPPESAILAVGMAKETPCVENGQIVVKSIMTMTISVDHRVIDGALAAQFMKKLKDILEDPYSLLV